MNASCLFSRKFELQIFKLQNFFSSWNFTGRWSWSKLPLLTHQPLAHPFPFFSPTWNGGRAWKKKREREIETKTSFTWSSDEKILTTPVVLVEWSLVSRSRKVTWSWVMRLSTITFHSRRDDRLVEKKSGAKKRSKASFRHDFLVTWNPLSDANSLEDWVYDSWKS